MTKYKPFIKWVGGKSQLLPQIDAYLPPEINEREFNYIEPFVGGGAMLFHMLSKYENIKKVVINDINIRLINTYKLIKEQPDKLVEGLKQIADEYYSLTNEEARKEFYLSVRDKFNNTKESQLNTSVYLMFLNRTCFNGLYRENSKGQFNVPFGRYDKPVICNEEIIYADHDALNSKSIEILSGDFSQVDSYIDNSSLNFFYFDPPYRPLSSTSSFNSYSKNSFNDEEQIRLSTFCKKLTENDLFILSNSDCSSKNPNDRFFENIYSQFNINRVSASRSINADKTKRGKLTELLITNY